MSEEELKVIERFKKIREETDIANRCGLSTNDFKEDLEIYDAILNLIEKQQKELERFNNELDLDYVDNNFVSKDKIREYLEKRINDVKKAYDDLTEPYYIEGVGFNISYMTKKEKEEFINKRNCLIVQKQAYKEILDKVEEKYEK